MKEFTFAMGFVLIVLAFALVYGYALGGTDYNLDFLDAAQACVDCVQTSPFAQR